MASEKVGEIWEYYRVGHGIGSLPDTGVRHQAEIIYGFAVTVAATGAGVRHKTFEPVLQISAPLTKLIACVLHWLAT